METPETRYAKSGDVWIAYQVIGDGPFDVVFIPPFITHIELMWTTTFARTLETLSSFCRLIRFDKRGTGMSDGVAGAPDARDSYGRCSSRHGRRRLESRGVLRLV